MLKIKDYRPQAFLFLRGYLAHYVNNRGIRLRSPLWRPKGY